jgi:hypothetical protein
MKSSKAQNGQDEIESILKQVKIRGKKSEHGTKTNRRN